MVRLNGLMMLTERYRTDLLALVDRYKLISGKADSTVSQGAFPNDTDFVSRLRRGKNVTLDKTAKLESYIDQRIEEIRKQLATRTGSHGVTQEVHPLREAPSESSTSDRSEEGGLLTDDDGNEYRHRGFASPHGV
jgi:hypothetical protein